MGGQPDVMAILIILFIVAVASLVATLAVCGCITDCPLYATVRRSTSVVESCTGDSVRVAFPGLSPSTAI